MKTATVYSRNLAVQRPVPYPNAVNGRILHKVLDLLLVAAMGAGCAAMLLFVLVLV